MSSFARQVKISGWFTLLGVALTVVAASAAHGQEQTQEGTIHVALVDLANQDPAKCFSDGFLEVAARETEMPIARQFERVALVSQELFNYPFIVMTGDDEFTLTDDEKTRLKDYLEQGGFVLASAGCSSEEWGTSFEAVVAELFGRDAMKAIDTEHPLFHTVYDIDQIQLKHREPPNRSAISVLSRNQTVRIVYSPMGLNDTANAGQGCCCCGGNEVRNARYINANILAYALTH